MLATTKNQVTVFWKKQSKPQQVTLLALLVAALVLVPILITWASKPSYSVVYKDLSEADASQIVQKLDESGTPYTLQDSSTILVESDQVYQVRLQMARDGLPESSTVGYELFDGNMLGMTEFLQRVNYQRALEGELERTIGNLAAVEMVRVHIVTPEKTLLSEDQELATASITIQQKQGQALDSSQVRAITHLVASSVEGLDPENVVVIDTDGAMLSSATENGMENAASQSDSQRAAEAAAAADVKKRVSSMLDKVLGPNRYVAQASVRMDWNQKEVTSNVFDPTPAAVRSLQDVKENYTTDGSAIGGVPGAGSNLPTPVPGVAATGEAGYYNRSEQIINYEISQTETIEKIQPGQVTQISVSIMVDEAVDAAQMESIKTAAAAAAGINADRGDQIVVESVDFDTTYYEAQVADFESEEQMNRYIQYGLAGAAVLLLFILLLYFRSSIKRLRSQTAEGWRPVLKPVSELALEQGAPLYSLSMGGEPAEQMSAALQAAQPALTPTPLKRSDEDMLAELSSRSSSQTSPEDEQKARIIQRLTEESPTTVAEIIQIWLNEDERKNG